MFKNQFVIWPGEKWEEWRIYDILTRKLYKVKTRNLTKGQQKNFFWTDISYMEKEKLLTNIEEKTLFNIFKSQGFFNEGNYYKKYPIDHFIKLDNINSKFILLVDRKINKEFMLHIKNRYDLSVEYLFNSDVGDINFLFSHKFVILPIFNYYKLCNVLKHYKSIIPITISDSDLIIGPKLNNKNCPCIDCLRIRLGSSSIDPDIFERQMVIDIEEPQFLKNNFFNTKYSNIADLTVNLIIEYIMEYQKGRENWFVRYNLSKEKMYKNEFLGLPHPKFYEKQIFRKSGVRDYVF